MSTAKLDYLKKIEVEVQKRWEEQNLGQSNAPEPVAPATSPPQAESKSSKKNKRKKSSGQQPATTPSAESIPVFGDDKKKFFCCFPYPYMNGRLHLGHTFSLSKCEFTARYKLLQGYNVLFPFGFHCTGMPIKACADKLKREIELFGNPPVFPDEDDTADTKQEDEPVELKMGQDKSKGKKSKAVAKAGSSKWQWDIMLSLGIPEDLIPKFAEDKYWLNFFPHHAVDDLKKMGLYVDWRRSFITTDVNPVYDSFIRWQFNLLYKKQKIQYGKRYCIFSPKDNQPCMDHDRSTGEGVAPQEYTLVKLKLEQPYPKTLANLKLKDQVYLVPATLRPETMYGQTNCWIHPDIEYIVVQTKQNGIFICTRRSARNMAYQDILASDNKVEPIATIRGDELIGCAVSSALSHYPKFYVLPLFSIKEDKGTGVVTSVPAEAPDDYVAWKDLVNNKALRDRFNIPVENVEKFQPVAMCTNEDLGEFPAVKVCDEMGITSPNDKERLRIAKEKVYLKGFYEARMSVGEHKGSKVQDVKKAIQTTIIKDNNGVKYMEPEKEVISRSADECVVALCNQWFLTYGDEQWKGIARKALTQMNLYHDEVRRNFEATLDWLQEHACSRTYGLGTKLPWDPQWLIESLSDSTIYMAYYTIKHILEGLPYIPGKLAVDPKLLTDEVWSYIFFLDAPLPEKCGLDQKILNRCRREFHYWYPVDLRVSGKDLVQNHLTYYIYNHCAVWDTQPDKWPQGIRANGHLLLNSEKMSKSTGNFMTLTESIDRFGADAMRFALADSGDSIEDANFVVNVADSTILRLYTFLEWAKKLVETKETYRTTVESDYQFQDSYFENKMIQLTDETESNYEQILFKEAVKTGFFEMLIARDQYREICGGESRMKYNLLVEFIKLQAIMISPVCPHMADYIWTNILNLDGGIKAMRWPSKRKMDVTMLKSADYFFDTVKMFRSRLTQFMTSSTKKGKQPVVEPPTNAIIWVAKSYPEWQAIILNHLTSEYKGGNVPENNKLAAHFAKIPELKKYQKKVMPFVQKVKSRVEVVGAETGLQQTLEFDEIACLNSNSSYLSSTLEIESLSILATESTEDDKIKQECCPGTPYITFGYLPRKLVKLANPQPLSGLIALDTYVLNDDTVGKLKERLAKERHLQGRKIALYRYKDPVLGPRKIPVPDILSTGRLVGVQDNDVFTFVEESPVLKLVSKENGKKNEIELGNELLYIVDDAKA